MSNKILSKNQILSYSIISLALMLILSYIEALFPISIGGVGIKVGLSNILTIIGILILGAKMTFIINILRLLIMGVFFGNIIRFQISLFGFLLSFLVMLFLLKTLKFSIITTSIFGAVFHNIGQLLAVAIIIKNNDLLNLTPIYIMLGIITGSIIGVITDLLYKKLILIMFDKN